jgi:hypothetical protein
MLGEDDIGASRPHHLWCSFPKWLPTLAELAGVQSSAGNLCQSYFGGRERSVRSCMISYAQHAYSIVGEHIDWEQLVSDAVRCLAELCLHWVQDPGPGKASLCLAQGRVKVMFQHVSRSIGRWESRA